MPPDRAGRTTGPAGRDGFGPTRLIVPVVPSVAGRSLWVAAAWTGLATMLAGAITGIVAVALCWLPVSGSAGNANSTIRAGVLTFLAALHGGITLDGVAAAFVPLGMTVAVGAVAWRAGCGLADVAEDLGETSAGRLLRAGALQAGTFALACGIAAAAGTLGTTSVSVPGAVVAAFLLFAVTGGVALLRYTALADEIALRAPIWLAPAARAGAAVVGVYLAAGALLVAVSLAVHHSDVMALSRESGGGWSGLPILLLGALAAPNAAIAGAGYLAGPGFAVGSGTTVALQSSPRGTLPSFPVLGALPHGHAAWPVWVLAVATPLVAGGCVARIAGRSESRPRRWQVAGAGVVGSGVLALLLAWQAGGAIGSGRLHVVGSPPWQFGLAVAGAAGVVAAIALTAQVALEALDSTQRDRRGIEALRSVRDTVAAVAAEATQAATSAPPDGETDAGGDRLAG